MRLYHQDLTTHAIQPRLKIDKLGTGDFEFVDPNVANSNPVHTYEPNGLFLSMERPLNVNTNLGVFAAINLNNLTMPLPARFVLTATFREPKQISLTADPAIGTYAASVLLTVTGKDPMGVTSQFRTSGQRLNLPGTNVMPNRPDISSDLSDKVKDSQDPIAFTLVLYVNRGEVSSKGEGRLYVADKSADKFAFTFAHGLKLSTIIDRIQVGLGTANGAQFRVSLRVLEFEVWAPAPNQ